MLFSFEVHTAGYHFDAVGHENGVVASVELKRHLGTIMCDWWLSGLNNNGELVALARLNFGMGELDERTALTRLPETYAAVIEPMISAFQLGGGLPSAPNPPSVQTKVALCKMHLDQHLLEGNIGEHIGIKLNAARQYQLIKSFGLKAARPLIAEREGLPISTISRRLYMAREAGMLAKLSDADDINN